MLYGQLGRPLGIAEPADPKRRLDGSGENEAARSDQGKGISHEVRVCKIVAVRNRSLSLCSVGLRLYVHDVGIRASTAAIICPQAVVIICVIRQPANIPICCVRDV
jgi:hypothetical protein